MEQIQVIFPEGMDVEEVSNLLYKANKPLTPKPDLSFSDSAITKIAEAIVLDHKAMYRSMLKEISIVLDQEYS